MNPGKARENYLFWRIRELIKQGRLEVKGKLNQALEVKVRRKVS